MDRLPDALISAAAADIGDRRVDLGIARLGIGLEERGDGHDHAGLAIAALRHLPREPGALHGMAAILRQAFDGGDLGVAHRRNGQRAGALRLAIDQHGAGAAFSDAAAIFRTGEIEAVAQHPEERRIILDLDGVLLAVDGERDHARHPLSIVKYTLYYLSAGHVKRLPRAGSGEIEPLIHQRHPRESGDLGQVTCGLPWISASAGMTPWEIRRFFFTEPA